MNYYNNARWPDNTNLCAEKWNEAVIAKISRLVFLGGRGSTLEGKSQHSLQSYNIFLLDKLKQRLVPKDQL